MNIQITYYKVVSNSPEHTNMISLTMMVAKVDNDGMIQVLEVLADGSSRIVNVIFHTELEKTIFASGLMMQLAWRISKPPKHEPRTSENVDAD